MASMSALGWTSGRQRTELSVEPKPPEQLLAELLADGQDLDPRLIGELDPDSDSVRGLERLHSVLQAFEAGRQEATVLSQPDFNVQATGPARGSEQGPETWGPLQVESKLGEGAFGSVYVAYEPQLKRRVALKLLSPKRRRGATADRDILEEARRLALVRHPNVLIVHGAGTFEGLPGFWTDLVPGDSLSYLLHENGPFNADQVVELGLELCRALTAIHDAGLAHGDIKAGNVIRERASGRHILLDFGSAVGEDAGSAKSLTPICAAPEVLNGGPPSRASDIYSVGVLLFQLATGSYPISPGSLEEIRQAHADGRHQRLGDKLPSVDDRLEFVLERAMSPDPRRRFRSAGEMEILLSQLVSAQGIGSVARAQPPKAAIPVHQDRVFGRERDVLEIRRLLDHERMVHLVGTGGTGKTRLAVEVASSYGEFRTLMQHDVGHGGSAHKPKSKSESLEVGFVDLSTIQEDAQLELQVLRSLGVRANRGHEREDLLLFLGRRPTLLVLDNCEHMGPAVARLCDEIFPATDTTILTTSRSLLRTGAGTTYEVPTLTHSMDAAVGLFVDRARKSAPQFSPTDEDTTSIVEIVNRLDGLPLAIELAAARMSVLRPGQIAERLSERFDILGTPGSGGRQETLRASLDWSYSLLQAAEQDLLMNLSAFNGSFTFEAVEGICFDETSRVGPLDIFSRLVESSLVHRVGERPDGRVAFRLQQNTREYAADLMEGQPEAWKALRARYVSYWLSFAQDIGGRFERGDVSPWSSVLSAEWDNLRQALEWSLDDLPLACRFFDSIRRWIRRGPLAHEAQEYVQEALRRARTAEGEPLPPRDYGRLLLLAASHAANIAEYEAGLSYLRQAQALLADDEDQLLRSYTVEARFVNVDMAEREQKLRRFIRHFENGAPFDRGTGHSALATLLGKQARYDEAREFSTQALKFYEEAEDPIAINSQRSDLAFLAINKGRHEEAESIWRELLNAPPDTLPAEGPITFHFNLGVAEAKRGNLAEARRHYDAAFEAAQKMSLHRLAYSARVSRAVLQDEFYDENELKEAQREATDFFYRNGDLFRTATSIAGVQNRLTNSRRHAEAAVVAAALQRFWDSGAVTRPPGYADLHDQFIEDLKKRLGDGFSEPWHTGYRMELEELIEYVAGLD